MKKIVEVCAGSLEDCLIAQSEGADRIELNNAIHLGGLTPSLASLILAKEQVEIPIITMLRARPGGFFYNEEELETMYLDAKLLIEHGADGIVFGFLNSDASIDIENTKKFVDLANENNVEAIFNRAFDRANDPIQAIEDLIECGVDRVLTSGQMPSADLGIDLLAKLNADYGDKIGFCVGAGVNKDNVKEIIEKTDISEVHSSFKVWYEDPTTNGNVSYQYSSNGDYEGVGKEKLKEFIDHLR